MYLQIQLVSDSVVILIFSLLQSNLYPTVGLQTPGEVVEANFGQKPFVYDIEEVMKVRLCGYFMEKKLMTVH